MRSAVEKFASAHGRLSTHRLLVWLAIAALYLWLIVTGSIWLQVLGVLGILAELFWLIGVRFIRQEVRLEPNSIVLKTGFGPAFRASYGEVSEVFSRAAPLSVLTGVSVDTVVLRLKRRRPRVWWMPFPVPYYAKNVPMSVVDPDALLAALQRRIAAVSA